MKFFRRILFATDFSPASDKAFDEAIDLARANEAELMMVHAYQPAGLLPTDISISPAVYDELDEKLRAAVAVRMNGLVEEARRRGVEAGSLILSGYPDEAITEAAREKNADLVVVGTHGRTGASRFFLGSIAARVITSAPCPVMTVPAA